MARKKISPINEDFDFRLMITIARKNFLWVMLFLLSALLLALVIVRYTPPVYEATAVLQISEQNSAKSVLNDASLRGFTETGNKLATSIELIRSKVIIERVIRKLPLQVSYFSKGEILSNELYRQTPFTIEYAIKDSTIFGQPVFIDFIDNKTFKLQLPEGKGRSTGLLKINSWYSTPFFNLRVSINDYEMIKGLKEDLSSDAFYFVIQSPDLVVASILSDISVAILNPDAKTLSLKLKEKNALKAADIVNGICSEFNKYDLEKNSEVSYKILDFIDNTISGIDIELGRSEDKIERFKKQNKIVDPDFTASTVLRKLDELQTQFFSIEQELNLNSKIRKEVNTDIDLTKFILSLYGRSEDNTLTIQLNKLQDLADQLEEVKIQATQNSEIYRSVAQRVRNQQAIINKILQNEESRLQTIRADKLAEIRKYESQLGEVPQQQAEFARLQRLFNINEKFYSLLLEKKAEFSITRAGYVPQHVVLQEAKYDNPPVEPQKSLIISSCLIIGFLASFILIIARYLLYNEINALEEIGHYTDATLLGIVPKYKREIPISQLLVDKNPKSVISEAFRSIRTNLQFISNSEGAKLIVVTSTISGEGKTFNAINLAGVIAFSGVKVVILDLDMRKPKIHLGFNVENNKGVSTLLIGKNTLEDCIIKSSLSNLDFITAGPIPPNPAELIINPKMDLLLENLKNLYDVIIIDLPPIGIVSDGIPMMQKADYPLYILRANYSRKMFIAQINKLMSENKVPNLSVILNGVEMSRLKYGYGYGYSYGYGYGYGYSYGYGYYEDDNEPKGLMDKFRSIFIRKP